MTTLGDPGMLIGLTGVLGLLALFCLPFLLSFLGQAALHLARWAKRSSRAKQANPETARNISRS